MGFTSQDPQRNAREAERIRQERNRQNRMLERAYENGNDGGCFARDTKIYTNKGLINIQDIKPNDFIISIDSDGELVNRRVISTKTRFNKKVKLLTTSENYIIKVTPSHSLQKVFGVWKRVSQLKKGDYIDVIDSNGIPFKDKIINIKKHSSETVYNLVIEEDFNFIANGFVAHSFSYFKKIKSIYYSIIVLFSKIENKVITKRQPIIS